MRFDYKDIWITKYVGTPYVQGGRTIDGFDCWGLVYLVWKNEYGVELDLVDDVSYWSPEDCKKVADKGIELANNALENGWMEVPVEKAAKGSVLTVNMRGQPMHCAVVVKPGVMAHALEHVGCHISDYRSFLWERRIDKAYSYAA